MFLNLTLVKGSVKVLGLSGIKNDFRYNGKVHSSCRGRRFAPLFTGNNYQKLSRE